MKTIGVLVADRMGQMSQSFCLQKMREAKFEVTIVVSKYFSGSVRADCKVADMASLRKTLGRFDDDDLVVCSPMPKAYHVMAAKGAPKPGMSYAFSQHFQAVEKPMSEEVLDKIAKGGSFSFTAGSLREASGQPKPTAVDTTVQTADTGSRTSKTHSRVIVGLASYPAREDGMMAVVKAISPQCDEMHVALNEYEGDRLAKVLRRLEPYKNVFPKAYAGEDDLGCQNKFRAVDLCGDYDYFLTVDDDWLYPANYVAKMVSGCAKFDGGAFVSCEGVLYQMGRDGRLDVSKAARYESTMRTCTSFVKVSVPGNATSCCMPRKIGLSFDQFKTAKNTGDDELVAKYLLDTGIDMYVVPHVYSWIKPNRVVRRIRPLSSSMDAVLERRKLLIDDHAVAVGENDMENATTAQATPVYGGSGVTFHVVTPFFNSSGQLKRCL